MRGKKTMMMASLSDSGTHAKTPASAERKVVDLWIPPRYLLGSGVDALEFAADANARILQRGFVLPCGQVLTTPLAELPPPGILQAEMSEEGWAKPIRFGRWSMVIMEPIVEEIETPRLREWSDAQRAFFALDSPFQMGEDGETYTSCHISTIVHEPYLFPGENIAAIVHGERDNYIFNCACHFAAVVYTTKHRLVCMSCGGTHLVVKDALGFHPKRLLTTQEWFDHFDEDGVSSDEEIDMSIVDFQDVEGAKATWQTDLWEEAKHRFIFFSRSSAEEIAEATRGTEADPSIFLEAGWTPIELPPAPAQQIAEDSVDVDLVENAGHAMREGVAYFRSARRAPEDLVTAIPLLFRAVELLLKARLVELSSTALSDQPNSPAVLKRLAAANVKLHQAEVETITRLRRLRNDLQHGAAKFNYRRGLAVSKASLIFIDRFASTELNLWIGDVVALDDWGDVLRVPEIAATAERIVEARLVQVRRNPTASIVACMRCGKCTLVRLDPRTGASCLYCGYVPQSDGV